VVALLHIGQGGPGGLGEEGGVEIEDVDEEERIDVEDVGCAMPDHFCQACLICSGVTPSFF